MDKPTSTSNKRHSEGQPRMTRRAALAGAGLAAVTLAGSRPAILPAEDVPATSPPQRRGLGLVIYDCNFRRKWLREQGQGELFEPLAFLEHCRQLGAGGMQAALGILEPREAARLRDLAQQHGLFIDAIVRPPQDAADLDRFEAEIRTAAAVGANAARTVIMPGRRYERFQSLEEFREFERRGRRMLQRAAPVVEKHRVPLAVENHKDQRIEERVALLKSLNSEFIGACVDTGNSFALLDDPIEAVEALAPFAFSVHLKDQAVQEYEDGFLLGDIPLGQGCFDLKRMVSILRRHKPHVPFALELITRDPLKVPCLTSAYWATMPAVPGEDLARTLRLVRQHRAEALQQVSGLPLERQMALEDANIAASLAYARRHLDP